MLSHRKSSTRTQLRTRAVASPSLDTILGVDLWAQKYQKRNGSTLTGPAQRHEIELFLQLARKKKQKDGKAKKSGMTWKATTAEPPIMELITINIDSAKESKKPPGTRKSTVEDASIQVDESEEAQELVIKPNINQCVWADRGECHQRYIAGLTRQRPNHTNCSWQGSPSSHI